MAQFNRIQPKFVRKTAQTLTGSFATLRESGATDEASEVALNICNQTAIAIAYTADTTAVNPLLFVRIQFYTGTPTNSSLPPADNDAGWTTEQIKSSTSAVSGGVWQSVLVDRNYLKTGVANTKVNILIPIPANALFAKVQVKETKDSGSFGVATGNILFGNT